MRGFAIGLLLCLGACEDEYLVHDEHRELTCCAEPHHTHTSFDPSQYPTGYGSSVMVLQSRHLDRATEVVGILDIHLPVGAHDAPLAQLRAQAAAMGADAVVGAEFHHGERQGEPIHVSGLAVRFVQLAPAY